MENEYKSILEFASTDKSITSSEFRLFYYIINNSDNLVLSDAQKKLNFKTFNLISKSLKKLLSLGYITRTKKHKFTTFKEAKYLYSVNADKPLYLENITVLATKDYFYNISYLFDYFFLRIPTKNKIDVSKNKKSISLMLEKDLLSLDCIKEIIDYVSIAPHLKHITRPLLLRAEFNQILKAFHEQK